MPQKASVLVVVLGDIGHSPRMIHHILELTRNGHDVDVIAYLELSLPECLAKSHKVHFHPIAKLPSIVQFPRPFSRLPLPLKNSYSSIIDLLFGLFKVLFLSLILLWIMFFRLEGRPKIILNQNPPAIPILMILPLVRYYYSAKWIVDWHNYGYSILQMSKSPNSLIVRLAKRIEVLFGKMADYHICVTEALKKDFIRETSTQESQIVVCYDHPQKQFRKSTLDEMHQLFRKLQSNFLDLSRYLPSPDGIHAFTPFTECCDHNTCPGSQEFISCKQNSDDLIEGSRKFVGNIKLRHDRPAFLISSTSWTVDEDFHILLDAIDYIEKRLIKQSSDFKEVADRFPQVIIIITGKGPLREAFLQDLAVRQTNWCKFAIYSEWFVWKYYPILLGSADLGLSFHTSASGLDFPMKIVDMLGSDLPVLSRQFACLAEVFVGGENSSFQDAKDLADKIYKLLFDFPHNEKLSQLQRDCAKENFWPESWSEHWAARVKPWIEKPQSVQCTKAFSTVFSFESRTGLFLLGLLTAIPIILLGYMYSH